MRKDRQIIRERIEGHAISNKVDSYKELREDFINGDLNEAEFEARLDELLESGDTFIRESKRSNNKSGKSLASVVQDHDIPLVVLLPLFPLILIVSQGLLTAALLSVWCAAFGIILGSILKKYRKV